MWEAFSEIPSGTVTLKNLSRSRVGIISEILCVPGDLKGGNSRDPGGIFSRSVAVEWITDKIPPINHPL